MGEFALGQAVRRKEDDRFVTGTGDYTDDAHLPGELHAVFVRSPYAHAKVVSIDTAEAKSAPGVIDVLTQEDVVAGGAGPLPCISPALTNLDGSECVRPPRTALADGVVRHVGEPVAVVIAETRLMAADAAELVMVDYEDLPAIADTEGATKPGAPQIWETNPGNLVFDWGMGDHDGVEQVLSGAAHVAHVKVINNRVAVAPIEPRAFLAHVDEASDRVVLRTPTQGSNIWNMMVSGFVFGQGTEKMRVVAPDVGGSFGMKGFLYPEQIVAIVAAKKLRRPVRWVSDRSEAFLTDNQGRDNVTEGWLALDGDGNFLGLKVRTIANMGAYLSAFATAIGADGPAGLQLGTYDIPAFSLQAKGVFTNTTPVDAYRGAGRPEASYIIERLVDRAAAEMKIDPAELRLKNLVKPEQMPFTNAGGIEIDCGDFPATFRKGLETADYAGFAARRAASEADGKLRGFGICYYMEETGGDMPERGRVRITEDGEVIIYSGNKGSGQGHATVFAQLVSERLGVPFEKINFMSGDSDDLESGGVAGGSSSCYTLGTAFDEASQDIVAKGRELAAEELEVAASDLEFVDTDGLFRVSGTDRAVSLLDLGAIAARKGSALGLIGDGTAMEMKPSFPNGTHLCEVEVDPDTGSYRIERYTVCDDFGFVMNPMIVDGQVHGGVAQGLGQAMGEEVAFDPSSGQVLNGSFMDYFMPRADSLPSITVVHNPVMSDNNRLHVKGCGEAGATGSSPAFVNAILDALRPKGVEHVDMPVTPLKVWQALHG